MSPREPKRLCARKKNSAGTHAMPNLNKVMLMGNLTRDIEVKYTPKGTAVADNALAVNRVIPATDGMEKREETTFVDVTFWGRTAEIVNQYCKKGSPLFVEGRLQLDTWDDKQTGQKRKMLRVVAEGIQLLGARGASGPSGSGSSGPPPSHLNEPPPATARMQDSPSSAPDDDDIPF